MCIRDRSETFNLLGSVKRLIEERNQALAAKQLSVNLPKVDNFICQGDQILLSQAIANLLDNAISFSHKNTTLTISMEQDQNTSNFALANKGERIPDFAKNKLFERFFSLPRKNEDGIESKSTGLGLSFVKQIMKLHQGSVSIKNTKDGVLAKLTWPN